MRFNKISGFEPNDDIKIEITGLRPGEKLYEELLMSELAEVIEEDDVEGLASKIGVFYLHIVGS